MAYETKYVVVEGQFGLPVMIVFSDLEKHSVVARGRKVISAGFIAIGVDDKGYPVAGCYGRSESLNKESRPEEDSKLANKQILRRD